MSASAACRAQLLLAQCRAVARNISWHLTAVLATILSLVARQEDAMYRDRDAEASF
jgi:hypothetical protein